MRKKGYIVRGHCCKDELHNLATSYSIELTKNVKVVEEGWCGKAKGLLQVLWEGGMIDKNNLSEYSLKGKKEHKDKNSNVKPEFRCFLLCTSMSNCTDFLGEKTAMEVLLDELSSKTKNNQTIKLLTSPKYHCELSGEGIDFAWGLSKRFYCNKCLEEKIQRASLTRS